VLFRGFAEVGAWTGGPNVEYEVAGPSSVHYSAAPPEGRRLVDGFPTRRRCEISQSSIRAQLAQEGSSVDRPHSGLPALWAHRLQAGRHLPRSLSLESPTHSESCPSWLRPHRALLLERIS
jgi:hypothetical protein